MDSLSKLLFRSFRENALSAMYVDWDAFHFTVFCISIQPMISWHKIVMQKTLQDLPPLQKALGG